MTIKEKRIADFEEQREVLKDLISEMRRTSKEISRALKVGGEMVLIEPYTDLVKALLAANKELTALYKELPKDIWADENKSSKKALSMKDIMELAEKDI